MLQEPTHFGKLLNAGAHTVLKGFLICCLCADEHVYSVLGLWQLLAVMQLSETYQGSFRGVRLLFPVVCFVFAVIAAKSPTVMGKAGTAVLCVVAQLVQRGLDGNSLLL